MDSQQSFWKRIPQLLLTAGLGSLFVFIGISFFVPSVGKNGRFLVSALIEQLPVLNWLELGTYQDALRQLQAKVDAVRYAEQENVRLRLENSRLKSKLEDSQFGYGSQKGAEMTQKKEITLSRETGSRVGRTLASLGYRMPRELIPSQLYTLGVSYLKAREDEKAAVIFTWLTGMEGNTTYQTAKNLLTTGVLWYRLENYRLADEYFDQVLKKPEKSEVLQFQAEARLWKALVAKQNHKDLKAQFWLKDLLSHHPHSREASWINPIEVPRGPASN